MARRIHTKTRLIRRVAVITILIVAASAILMTFPDIRHIGISLFASAGVAGLIAGMAARPVLSNVIAGIQIEHTVFFGTGPVTLVLVPDVSYSAARDKPARTWPRSRTVLPCPWACRSYRAAIR